MGMKKNLVITQGATLDQTVRWETEPFLFKAITAMTNTAPVTITTATHGIPDGWRVAVVDAGGMTELNAANNPPKSADFRQATVVDATHIEFNPISAVEFGVYTSGGYLQWYTPHDLASYTARMSIKDKIGGTVRLSLTTENGGITLSNTDKTITLAITATATAALTWTSGVYDLELISSGGFVTSLMNGSVSVTKEVTSS